MIIKSMSRSTKSFTQIIHYLDKEEALNRQTYNMYARTKKQMEREFLENARHLKNTRGKNYLYHEVLSLEQNNLSLEKQQEILHDLSQKYVSLRAKNNLVLAVTHNDTNHLHMHLVISANEVYGNKREWLSKKEFKSIQATLEEYKNTKYPELGRSNMYQQQKDYSKSKQTEQEIKHKKKKTPKKEKVRSELEHIFSRALSKKSLHNTLTVKGYELYTRGKTTGVIYEAKKYRLKTLGLDKAYTQTLNRVEKRKVRREKWKDLQQSK